jgi:MoaA/NifB/PqqE/SkfB family radical SAM enzyme
MAVGLFTTSACNLSCRMCSIWRDPERRSLAYEQAARLIDAVTPGCCYFSFSGGEPLLVPEIERMIAYAAARIPYVHLVSNGLLVDSERCRRLSAAGLHEISISLDGEASWHDQVRGRAGCQAAALAAIDCLRGNAPGIRIVLNAVLFPGAVAQARAAVALARARGVLIKIQPVNRHFDFPGAASAPEEIDFNRTDDREVEEFIGECLAAPHVVNSRYYLKRIPDYFRGRLSCPPIHPRCRLPFFFLEANAHGFVSPCMIATGWESELDIEEFGRPEGRRRYHRLQDSLTSCRRCEQSMYICYWEPMIHFPLMHFLKYRVLG